MNDELRRGDAPCRHGRIEARTPGGDAHDVRDGIAKAWLADHDQYALQNA
jgi:hypothetical protein